MSDALPEFPLLGEPVVVELANSLYVDSTSTTDFFAHPRWVSAWFTQAVDARRLDAPSRWTSAQAGALRELRDAIRAVFDAAVTGERRGCASALVVVNNYAARAGTSVALAWEHGAAPRASLVHVGSKFDVLVTSLAVQLINLVAGPSLRRIRRCRRPRCPMFFMQQHHRRRYCNVRCAQSDRQARYHRRVADRAK